MTSRDILASHLDLRDALHRTIQQGAAFLRDALAPRACERILGEIEAGTFKPLAEQVGPVEQQVEALELRPAFDSHPAVERLRIELAERVHTDSPTPQLRQWEPNDVSIQRYRPGSAVGITPHRDGKRYGLLVAVVTLQGRAAFTMHRDRSSGPLMTWITAPGTLLLLRGAGLTGADDRPFHAVTPPLDATPRYSAGFRMDTRGVGR